MTFLTLSDTHGKHHQLKLPNADVLIHAGDVSSRGQEFEIQNFLHWMAELDYEHKIFIAGNHDFYFERTSEAEILRQIPKGITYLCDSGITINGVNIWGSPITPFFFNWAFNRKRGSEIRQHWNLIPPDTDVLITHGPPVGILDFTQNGQHAGCEDLLVKIEEVKPKVHIFGHIHEGYGDININDTRFINASVLNEQYALVNQPIVFEL